MPFGLNDTEWERLQELPERKPPPQPKPWTPRREANRRRKLRVRAAALSRKQRAEAHASVYTDPVTRAWIYRQFGLSYEPSRVDVEHSGGPGAKAGIGPDAQSSR